jgi:hypothetical protein
MDSSKLFERRSVEVWSIVGSGHVWPTETKCCTESVTSAKLLDSVPPAGPAGCTWSARKFHLQISLFLDNLTLFQPELQRNLVIQLCAATGLNAKFAHDCLAGNDWDSQRAIANFNAVKASLHKFPSLKRVVC